MCPGGQIVPTSTVSEELCINGMSFSKRAGKWANSGLVSTITEADATPYADDGYEPLCGVAFQRHIEREAAVMGGGDLVVPVQIAEDFLSERVLRRCRRFPRARTAWRDARAVAPTVSTRSHGHDSRITRAFRQATAGIFRTARVDSRAPGRTSSARRIDRDKETMCSVSMVGLYPTGEGAGYAGGIVSAACDGLAAAEAILRARV